MKKLLLVCLSVALLSGCSLWPKKVEYLQKKVKPLPLLAPKAIEHQRQAAQYVAAKTLQVEKAAIEEHCTTNVIVPAAEAAGAAAALTESLGPANKPFIGPASNIVQTLHQDQAKYNAAIVDYRVDLEPIVGKKVEGTGTVQIGYFWNLFLWVGGSALLVGLIYAGVKIYGMVNPAVGVGVGAAEKVASKVLAQGVSEIVAGGERFKAYIENSGLSADVKKWVTGVFTQAQMEAQSQNVQAVVTKLTAQSPITTPTAAPVTVAPGAPAASVTATPAPVTGSGIPAGIRADIVSWFTGLLTTPAVSAAQAVPAPATAQVATQAPVTPAAPASAQAAAKAPAGSQRITA